MFSNFSLSYSYNIFVIYFPSNFFFLKSLSSTLSKFSCHLTSIFILFLNFAITFFTSPKSFSLLFRIFSTFYFSTLSIFTSFTSSTFCPSTCFLYHTTWLMFTARWILIKVGNHNLITLVKATLLIIYRPIYQSTSFFASFLYLTSLYLSSFIPLLLFFPYLSIVSFLLALFLILLLFLPELFSFFL